MIQCHRYGIPAQRREMSDSNHCTHYHSSSLLPFSLPSSLPSSLSLPPTLPPLFHSILHPPETLVERLMRAVSSQSCAMWQYSLVWEGGGGWRDSEWLPAFIPCSSPIFPAFLFALQSTLLFFTIYMCMYMYLCYPAILSPIPRCPSLPPPIVQSEPDTPPE